jgi:hypothetical protein
MAAEASGGSRLYGAFLGGAISFCSAPNMLEK